MNLNSESPNATEKNHAAVLSRLFTREMILYIKTRYFQWMARHASFVDIGNLFEYQSMQLEMTIDEISCRLKNLQAKTINAPEESRALDEPVEIPILPSSPRSILEALLKDHEGLMHLLRRQEAVLNSKRKDVRMGGILTRWMQEHETIVWDLRRQQVQISETELQRRRKKING